MLFCDFTPSFMAEDLNEWTFVNANVIQQIIWEGKVEEKQKLMSCESRENKDSSKGTS